MTDMRNRDWLWHIAFALVCIVLGMLFMFWLSSVTSVRFIDDRVVMRLRYSTPVTQEPSSATDVSVAAMPRRVPVPVNSVTRSVKPVKVLYMEISAYSPTVAETDGNPLRTASGKTVYVGGIAADLRVLPFGSQVIIPNYNGGKPCTVIDTGGAIRGLKLDVFLWSAHEAVHWGRRKNVRVEVLYIPKDTR